VDWSSVLYRFGRELVSGRTCRGGTSFQGGHVGEETSSQGGHVGEELVPREDMLGRELVPREDMLGRN